MNIVSSDQINIGNLLGKAKLENIRGVMLFSFTPFEKLSYSGQTRAL